LTASIPVAICPAPQVALRNCEELFQVGTLSFKAFIADGQRHWRFNLDAKQSGKQAQMGYNAALTSFGRAGVILGKTPGDGPANRPTLSESKSCLVLR
jgi:hypothetical protein